jgi:hypothetical protein
MSCINTMNLRIKFKLFSVFNYNNKRENVYQDWRGKTFSFLNNSLQETLVLEIVIIVIAPFCSLKIWMVREELPQRIIP